MKRDIAQLEGEWDFIVIGGGATGLGVALDAASRGFRTILFERDDFAKGTSSRSTKLIHGGLRYLRQGNISLVREALHERGLLLRNAPHIVHPLHFVIPCKNWKEMAFYGTGVKLYDLLSGDLRIERSRFWSKSEMHKSFKSMLEQAWQGGIEYADAQFDDARLAMTLAHTIVDHGGVALNYMEVVGLKKRIGKITGVRVRDRETGNEYDVPGKVVVNATGVFSDAISQMDDPVSRDHVQPSQGIHLVLDRSFLPGDRALMIPHTKDGRVLFIIPWHDRILFGTTDTPVHTISSEPKPKRREVEYLLEYGMRYLAKTPGESDILSMFAGLRPLIRPGYLKKTSRIPRDHTILFSKSGLLSIYGGKWTTYRKMGEDVVNAGLHSAGMDKKQCKTETLKLHGWRDEGSSVYGSDQDAIHALAQNDPSLKEKLHPDLPYTRAEVHWVIRNEMARTVEDVLSRRLRALILDAKAAAESAPYVAQLLGEELGRNEAWINEQADQFHQLSGCYRY